MLLKLNLGSGYDKIDGWAHVDKEKYHNHQIVADVLEGLPFPDNHFDFVLMNHTLQVFTYNEHAQVLKEVMRVMKPDATLRILVPDLVLAFNAVIERNRDFFPISQKLESTLSGAFSRYIHWHGETRSSFDEFALKDLLERNGFIDFKRAEYGECELDSRKQESLIATCQKPL